MGRTRAERILRAFEGEVWALHPPKLEQVAGVLVAKATHGQIPTAEEVAAVEAQQRRGVRSQGSVAVVPLSGTVAKRLSSMDVASGGASIEAFIENVRSAAANPDVGSILLDVHSPGGSVYGVEEAFRAVMDARKQKRVVAIVNSLAASAAYWIAAGAEEIVATPSSEAGSIGVYMVHFDWTAAMEAEGVKATIIRAGEHKAEGNPYEALPDDAREHMQSMVDAYYGQFRRAIAKGRGVTVGQVDEKFGQGRTFDSARLVRLGMADRVATIEEVIEDLLGGQGRRRERSASSVPAGIAAAAPGTTVITAGTAVTEGDAAAGTVIAVEPVPSVGEFVQRAADLLRPVLEAGDWTAPAPPAANPDPAPNPAPAPEKEPEPEPSASEPASADPEPNPTPDPEPEGQDPASASDTPDVPTAAGGAAPEDDEPAPATNTQTAPEAKETQMSTKDTAVQSGAADTTVTADPMESERKRQQDIQAMCRSHDVAHMSGDFIAAGRSVDYVSAWITGRKEAERPGSTVPDPDPPVTLNERENKQYSLSRLLLAEAEKDPSKAGFEREIDRELRSKINYTPKGVLVPTTLGIQGGTFRRRDLENAGYRGALTTDTAAGGQELVFIEPGSFIDLLRSRMVLPAMGATFLPGLRGNVDFPKQTGAGEFSWVPESSESDTPADSDLDTGTVSLRPRNGRSVTSFSRTLLAQSVVNTEQLVRADLSAIGARGLDQSALHGTGQNNQPTGIYTASGVHPVAFGGGISFAKVVEMETKIAESDADIERMGYVSTPGVRGAAKTTQQFSGTNGSPIWTGGVRDGEVNGYRAMASTQARKDLGDGENEHALIFGAWEHVLVGEWGAMDILVDPYTRGGRGLIRVILFLIADIALRYPEAFSKATGLTVATDGS